MIALGLTAALRAAEAQPPTLPAVSLVLALEVLDPNAWLGMQQEILTTPDESPKPLLVSTPTRAGGHLSLTILSPRYTSLIASAAGGIVRVWVKGKVSGEEARQTLVPFMRAFSEPASATEVTVEYGLTVLKANLLELKIEDR
jgi:hypothetical protein